MDKLTKKENAIFNTLNTPKKIQDFLETLSINFEKDGDVLKSPREVLRTKNAQCFEGALFAAAALYYHGHKPLLLDLVTSHGDDSHVVALYKIGNKWGALSKTNHAVLRFRDAVYYSPREVAMSYFHEYFLDNGIKTLRSYAVYDLRKIKNNWIVDEKNLWYVDDALERTKHIEIISQQDAKTLRKADDIEILAGKIVKEKK